jgi:hypothetical protein
MFPSKRIIALLIALHLTAIICLPVTLTQTSPAQFSTQTKLSATDANPVNSFGMAVAVDGNTVVVGGMGSRFSGHPQGAVYVYVRDGESWTLQQVITGGGETPDVDDAFGSSVAISGNTIVVGSYADCSAGFLTGAAYVYVRNGSTWSLQQKLTASDAAPVAVMGFSVAIHGDTIVAGAHGDDDEGYLTGAAYVFKREGGVWTEQQKLKASDAASDTAFGLSVAVDNGTIAVGSPSHSTPAARYSGAVYVFVHGSTGWTEQQKMSARDITETQQLGYCVDISGDTIVATSPLNIVGKHTLGAAYVFGRNEGVWSEQRKLFDSDTGGYDGFALRAAIDGDRIVVGDATDNTGAPWGGAAYVYERSGNSGWSLHHVLTASDAAYLDFLGVAVAVSGDTVVAGSSQKENMKGAAYIFR